MKQRDQVEDLRRQLAERTFEKESFAADAIRWQKIARENEAALAAEQLRCKVAEERRDALSGELAEAKENLMACRDTREKLGEKWMQAERERDAAADLAKEECEKAGASLEFLRKEIYTRCGHLAKSDREHIMGAFE